VAWLAATCLLAQAGLCEADCACGRRLAGQVFSSVVYLQRCARLLAGMVRAGRKQVQIVCGRQVALPAVSASSGKPRRNRWALGAV